VRHVRARGGGGALRGRPPAGFCPRSIARTKPVSRDDRGWSPGVRTGSGGSMHASCALPCSDSASDSSPSGAPSPGVAWPRARAPHTWRLHAPHPAVASLHVPPLRSAMTEAGRTSRSGMAVRRTAHEPAPASRWRGAAPARWPPPPPRRACRAAARAARARAAPPRTGAAAPAGPARTARRGVQGVSQRSVAKPRMQRQQT